MQKLLAISGCCILLGGLARSAVVSEAATGEIFRSQIEVSSSPAQNSAGEAPLPCVTSPIEAAPLSEGDDQAMFDKFPPSRTYKFIKVDESHTYRLPQLIDSPAAPTQQQQGQTKQARIGAVRPLTPPLSPLAKSRCFDLGRDGHDRIMAIISEGARQIRAHFARVALPPEAKIFVYSMKNPNEVYGPYEGNGPNDDGTFWTPPLEGDTAVIEFYTPRSASGPEKERDAFQVTEISHVYRR